MVRRRNIQAKKRSVSKKGSRRIKRTRQPMTAMMIKQTPTENLDDETKLAKRHLTKEMWQLVSIAVKRMADELVSISNNQQTATRTSNQEQSTLLVDTSSIPGHSMTAIQQLNTANTGAGDEPSAKEKSAIVNEPIKRRASPLQMLEPSLHTKKKGSSNNATRRSVKSKMHSKPLKKNEKTTIQRLCRKQKSK